MEGRSLCGTRTTLHREVSRDTGPRRVTTNLGPWLPKRVLSRTEVNQKTGDSTTESLSKGVEEQDYGPKDRHVRFGGGGIAIHTPSTGVRD